MCNDYLDPPAKKGSSWGIYQIASFCVVALTNILLIIHGKDKGVSDSLSVHVHHPFVRQYVKRVRVDRTPLAADLWQDTLEIANM